MNADIANILSEIAVYLDMQSIPFKPRAFEKAADAVRALDEDIRSRYAAGGIKSIVDIEGVGASIAKIIEEIIKTGTAKEYIELKKRIPVRVGELMGVEGIGPKSIKKLYDALGIKDLEDLEQAVATGAIASTPGFGAKKQVAIAKSIEFLKKFGGRRTLGELLPLARELTMRLKPLKGIEKLEIAGSIRRRMETAGDIDIVAVSAAPEKIMAHFTRMPDVGQILAHGETKSSVRLKLGVEVDLRVVPRESFGAALAYFTGSKNHNVSLRRRAIQRGYTLNEYGLYKGKKRIAGKTEEEIYRTLGLDYIEPEMRENAGEFSYAESHTLPALIGYEDVRGDFQVQTDWTDGAASIESMARAAMRKGLHYMAVTDHTKRLAMTGGLDEKKIQKQWLEIDRVNKLFDGKMKVLKGSECDILKDGTLDLSDEVLAKCDVVGISVHSHFNLTKAEQTARIIKAMENPHADILFHPTGRLIGRRPAYEVDMDALIGAAKKTRTAMEIDALPDRLDLRDVDIRKCVEAGVLLTIDSDAHRPEHFEVLEYGIAQARRGWAAAKQIINTFPVGKALSLFK